MHLYWQLHKLSPNNRRLSIKIKVILNNNSSSCLSSTRGTHRSIRSKTSLFTILIRLVACSIRSPGNPSRKASRTIRM